MSNDSAEGAPSLLQASWRNKLPVRLTLAQDNISSPTPLRPLYVHVPRHGYLSTLASAAWPQVQHVLPALPGRANPRPWFDCADLPLKWWLPCGILFDLLCTDTQQIPWNLQIHYTPLPDVLTGWDNGASVQAQFLHSLKEACHICKGSEGSGAVMRMTGAAQDQLWAAVERGDGPAAASALVSLRVQPTQRQGQPASIPVRLLLRPASAASVSRAVWDQVTLTSRPVPSTTEAGEPTTLASVLSHVLPSLFPPPLGGGTERASAAAATAAADAIAAVQIADQDAPRPSDAAAHPLAPTPADGAAGATASGVAGATEGAAAAAPVTPTPWALAPQPGWPICKVLVGGIEPPLESPLGWLHASLHSADLFLYVVVRMDLP